MTFLFSSPSNHHRAVLCAAKTWRHYRPTRSGRKPSCWFGARRQITGQSMNRDSNAVYFPFFKFLCVITGTDLFMSVTCCTVGTQMSSCSQSQMILHLDTAVLFTGRHRIFLLWSLFFFLLDDIGHWSGLSLPHSFLFSLLQADGPGRHKKEHRDQSDPDHR